MVARDADGKVVGYSTGILLMCTGIALRTESCPVPGVSHTLFPLAMPPVELFRPVVSFFSSMLRVESQAGASSDHAFLILPIEGGIGIPQLTQITAAMAS